MIFGMTTARPLFRAARLPRRAMSVFAAIAVMLASTASPVRAQSDDEEALPDARLTGYEAKVDVGGGVALSYALVAVLGAIAVGVTFKNARRTHLD